MKTTIICFLLVTGLLGISISCCEDTHWDITGVQARVYTVNGHILSNGQISTDTLVILLDFELEYIAQQLMPNNPFINASYATSVGPHCPTGTKGMRDELTDLTITSSTDFNSYSAGTSLTPTVTIEGIPLQDWIVNRDYNDYYNNPRKNGSIWILSFNEKPSANNNMHDFKFVLTFASGRTEEVQLGAITWN